jgi:type IV secretory pathway VirB6-like protein
LQDASKELSLRVMEASAGDIVAKDGSVISEDKARSTLEVTQGAFQVASIALSEARTVEAKAQQAVNQSQVPDPALNLTLTDAQTATAVAQQKYNTALAEFNAAKSNSDSFGYKYCDFRDIEDSEYMVNGKDMKTMRLWDMVDCKISKYLGVGDYEGVREAPQILLIAIGSIFSHFGIGIFIFGISLVILIFILLITVRIVHIYIMASMGLVLLVYISPLLIPAALFKFTKFAFDAWLKQIIAYVLQPIILFAFLSFLFSAFDMVIYGGNHHFVPMTTPHTETENKLCMKNSAGERICSFENVDIKNLKCEDENALGCLYQRAKITGRNLSILSAVVYDIQFNNSEDGTSGEYYKAALVLLGLLKFLAVCFIAHSVLSLVEEMSTRLTNAAGGGGSGLSAMPTASVRSINNATNNKARSFAVGGIKKGVGALSDRHGRNQARERARLQVVNDLKNSKK